MLFLVRFALSALLMLFAFGCSSDQGSQASTATTSGDASSVTTAGSTAAPQDQTPSPLRPTTVDVKALPKPGDDVAVIETSMGRIVLEFFPQVAPKTVDNFKKLVEKKFYDGTKFHRVKPGFMIQGGDPNTKTDKWESYGQGDPGYKVKAEFNDISHQPGIVSMARSSDPDSAGSQFFIVTGDASFLDHQYTAFAKVVDGMDVVNKIVEVPTVGPPTDQVVKGKEPVIKSIRIEKWPVK